MYTTGIKVSTLYNIGSILMTITNAVLKASRFCAVDKWSLSQKQIYMKYF